MAKTFPVLVVAALLLACCFPAARPDETAEVRSSLVGFLTALAGGDDQVALQLRWDASVSPCNGRLSVWRSVVCNADGQVAGVTIRNRSDLKGTINATLLCAAPALRSVRLQGNALRGGLPEDISACSAGLRHFFLNDNQLSGSLPSSLAQFSGLSALDVSGNNFSGELSAGLGNLPHLVWFLANNNNFGGAIPDMDLRRFDRFSVSNNSLTGPIPQNIGSFGNDSFWPNGAGICGQPLFSPCPQAPSATHI